MPSELNVAGYIAITESQYSSQSVVGMRWNAELSTWEEVVDYFYAVLDENDVCVNVVELEAESTESNYIAIDSLDQTYVGKWYDRESSTWYDEAPFAVTAAHSTDEINVGTTNTCLTDALNAKANSADVYTKTEVDNAIAAAGTGSGSGTPGADGEDGEDGGYYTPSVASNGDLSWTASKSGMPTVATVNIKGETGAQGIQGIQGEPGADGTPGANGVTFTPTVSAAGVLSWTNDGGLTNPASVNIKGDKGDKGDTGAAGATGATGATGAAGADGVSPTVSVSKSGTVTTITITDVNGTHTATINDGAAGADGEDGADGNTITAAEVLSKLITVDGSGSGIDADKLDGYDSSAFSLANHTHSEYASSSHSHSGTYAAYSHTHSDYLPLSGGTMTGILRTGNGTQTIFNSGTMLMFGSNAYPSRICGSVITSSTSITVESDARLKENVAAVDAAACVDFINGIQVKTFNYKSNPADECIGVIAQELQESELGKLFVKSADGDMLSVKVADLVFPLIATVQELQKQVAELKK